MNLNFNLNLDIGTTYGNDKRNGVSEDIVYDALIIGGGPSGLNVALYLKRKGFEVGIISKKLGGLVMDTSSVDNYLGNTFISGEALAGNFVEHLKTLEVSIQDGEEVLTIRQLDNGGFELVTDSKKLYRSKTVIVTTGSIPKKLGIPGENEFTGRGVAYCAICDAPLYKGKDVIIAGGGNSAVEAAIDLSKHASQVTLVHRSELRADRIIIEQLYKQSNIKVILGTQILEIVGDTVMTGIRMLDKIRGKEDFIKADGIFVEIGHKPNTESFRGMLSLTDDGEIIIDGGNQTNVPGIFAAGDVTTIPYKQIVIAAGEGAKAALSASDYINKKFN